MKHKKFDILMNASSESKGTKEAGRRKKKVNEI